MMEYREKHQELKNRIFSISNADFEELALDVFHFQANFNETYRSYLKILNIDTEQIKTIYNIPFLPIQLFKNKAIKTGDYTPEVVFESSGTTGSVPSKHFVKDVTIYEESFLRSFHKFYGDIKNYCIIGLLPSYMERNNSSLVFMVDKLIKLSGHVNSGFYLHEFEQLKKAIQKNESNHQKTLLIGVSYALLDFSEKHPMQLENTIIMETGGMKGRREELPRTRLHELLKSNFGVREIHSEYGMTELLSQAYSRGKGIFHCPDWMKVMIRAEDDPFFTYVDFKNTIQHKGAVNIIDLANINSCSFIATEDSGVLYDNGQFEINGRLENSDIRGCGLMIL